MTTTGTLRRRTPRRRALRRRAGHALAAGLATALVAALGACASIPTSGPVTEGQATPEDPGQPFVSAAAPIRDASPTQIVQGFLAAQAQGARSSFDVASEFLTSDVQEEWSPLAQVAILAGEPELVVDESTLEDGTTTVRTTAELSGTVDEHGVYTEQAPGQTIEISYGLVRDDDDQWRIDAVDDGLTITEASFAQTYKQVNLYFPTIDRAYLVPDARWFPSRNWQALAVRETLRGPSEWLAGSVATVAPEGTALSIDSVPPGEGAVIVPLNEPVTEASPADRALLLAQLQASLGGRVEITTGVGGSTLSADEVPTIGVATTPDDPVVLSGDQIMSLEGRTTKAVASAAPLTGLQPTALAFRGRSSDAAYVVRDGGGRIVTAPTAESGPTTLLSGSNLLAPTIDRFQYLWSGPQVQAGTLQVVDLREAGSDAAVSTVAAPWLEGRTIMSVRVAPDGARVAVVSDAGSGAQIQVAGIVRDEAGRPTQLSEPVRVGQPVLAATQVTWVDRALLGVLGRTVGTSDPVVQRVPVGGPTMASSPVEDAVSLASATGIATTLVGTSDSSLYAAGTSTLWTKVATEVRLPTYPG
ncbi:LpqB family beta-propeller domain-containing protein [Cellulosimicrobium sp. NPDC055967]|uniref:LpqB family beta-propeller domain-containing protein n=1 Tax=Cellulosimicrobium sp. NPDC055967 TaxID=3345670 RepID=UPI0035D612AF